MHVLFVLQQRPVQFRQSMFAIPLQILGRKVFRQQQFQPVQHFRGRGFFLQPWRLPDLKELRQRGGQKCGLNVGEVYFHNRRQHIRIRKADVVKEATAQKCIRQFFFIVRGDDHHWAVQRLNGLAGLINMKLHPVEFLQQIVWELDIGLVDLVNQQNHAGRGGERLPQLAAADIVGHVMHPQIPKLAVAQPADRIVFIEALLRLGCGLYMPLNQRHLQCICHLSRQFGLARPRLALHQQGALQGHRCIDRNRQIVGDNIAVG